MSNTKDDMINSLRAIERESEQYTDHLYWQKKVAHLRSIADNYGPWSKGMLLIIAQNLEDGQPLSPAEREFINFR